MDDLKTLLQKTDELTMHELEMLYKHIKARRRDMAHQHLEEKPHANYPSGRTLTDDQIDDLFAEWIENVKHD